MNAKCLVTLILLLSMMFLPLVSEGITVHYPEGFNIVNIVNDVDTVVVGKVIKKVYVFRDNVVPKYTTDITVEVEELIKGKPNVGENEIRFMILGGRGVDPETGEDLICDVSDMPEFRMGERALLFLGKSDDEVRRGIHTGLYLFAGLYGKREIVNNKVWIPYTFQKLVVDNYDGVESSKIIDMYRTVELPLDVVIKIAKASIIDADALKELEGQVADVAKRTDFGAAPIIDSGLLKQLQTKADEVLIKEVDDEQ